MWIRKAQRTYDLELNGKMFKLTEEQIAKIIKNKLQQSLPIQKIFETFDVSLNALDNLNIKIVPLDKSYALTDEKEMRLNESLFKERDFFKRYMFVPVHELVHWLSRYKEHKAYFNDPEEVLGFTLSIAYDLKEGKSLQEIWREIYPKIKWHFHNERDSEIFFKRCINKAKQLINA